MRRTINFLTVIVLVTLLAVSQVTPALAVAPVNPEKSTEAPAQWTPGRVLVKYKPGYGYGGSSMTLMGLFGARRMGRLNSLNVEILEVPVGQELNIANALQSDPTILYAEPDYLVHAALVPNDTDYANQWAHPLINSEDAWDTSTGSGAVIAIIDSGIDPNHPDLQANIVAGYDFVDDDTDPTDGNGHGTHVAGIAAAVINNSTGVAGMAGDASIMPLRVLDASGSGSILDIADAITYAADNGADVANLSVGSTFNAMVLQEAVDYAYAADMVVVAAAGNNDGATQSYPAAHVHTIAVSATGPSDTYTYYTNYGQYVDVAAPGGEMYAAHDTDGIYSTMPTYEVTLNTEDGIYQNYDYLQGTSMAAPHVAGLVALLRSMDSTLTVDEIELIIEKSAVDLGDPGFDIYYGNGRIDVNAALELGAAFEVTSTVFYADDDAYFNDVNDVNWTAPYLFVGAYDRTLYRSVIKFDVSSIPVTATVESAELMLSLYGTIGDSQRFLDTRRITADWSEDNLTKNTDYGTEVYDTVAISGTYASWTNWNITDLVQDWVDGTYVNYGVTVMDDLSASDRPDNLFAFDSRQTTTPAYQPYLSVIYSVDLPCYTLDLSATDGNITADSAPNCEGTKYVSGTEVTLTANPDTGFEFSSWSGDLSGSTNPETITMDADKTVTANFSALATCYSLDLSADPLAGGAVEKSPGTCPTDSSLYLDGSTVTITATANLGYEFTAWSGDVTTSTNPETVTMDANKSVTANLTVLPCYTLSLNATNGSITPDPLPNCPGDGTKYVTGTVVEVTATPDSHYTFTGWSGDLSGTMNPDTVTVDSDKSVTASFAPICYTLTTDVSPAGAGTVTPSGGTVCPTDGGKYLEGSVVSLAVSENTGYSFNNWTGDLSGSDNPGSVTMDGDKSVTANFDTLACYTLTVNTTNGTVDADPAPNCPGDGSKYVTGTTVSLTPNAAAHYEFSEWTGDLTGSDNPGSIVVDADTTVTAVFIPICYTLTTDVSPAGAGTVTPSGGTVCPTDGGKYLEGSVVSLAVSENTGYSFNNWTGDLSGSDNPASITIDGDKSVTANFDTLACYTLTVNATNGTVDANPAPNCPGDTSKYVTGTTVSLTPNAAAHYEFSEWTGALTGSDNPGSIVVDADKTVTAVFTPICYTLPTDVSPAGAGTVTPSGGTVCPTDGGKYLEGSVVSLAVSENTGYSFSNWTGDLSSSDNPGSVTMDGDKSVTANFDTLACYTLSLSATDGSITPDVPPNCPGDGSKYVTGTSVELTATPDSHYSFTGWSGDLSGTTNPDTVTVDRDKSVTASFAPICYTLTMDVSPAGAGIVTPSGGTVCPTDGGKYLEGSVVSLAVNDNTGYSFNNWTGDLSGSDNPASVTMDGDKSVTANFDTLACYTLTVNATNGTVDTNPAPNCPGDTSKYVTGTTVSLTPNAAAHYEFSEWTGDLTGSDNPGSVTVDGDKTVTANFTPICFTLSTSAVPVAGGSVAKSVGTCPGDDTKYLEGSTATITATASTGYTFSAWSGDLSSSTNSETVTMNADKVITAEFDAVLCYSLTLNVTNGSVDVDTEPNCLSDPAKYQAGTVVELTATPDSYYNFTGWTGDLSGSTNPESITMDGDKTVTANFTEFACYDLTLTADPAEGGNVTVNTASNCGESGYYDGTVVEVTANPATHYVFISWSGDLSGTGNPRSVTMDNNKSVTASFDPICFTLALSSDPLAGGSITPSVLPNCPGDDSRYLEGTSVSLTATAAEGYTFSAWGGDLSGSANPRSITMDSDWDVSATFELIPCYALTLTADPSTGGNISVDTLPNCGTDQYYEGTVVELTAEAATGYFFSAWSGDLSGSTNPESINMDGDKSVTASFEEIVVCYDLTINVDPAGTGTVQVDTAPNCNDTQYAEGTVVTLTAVAEDGYEFVTWSGALSSIDNPLEVTVNADTVFTATFQETDYIVYIPMALKH